MLELAADYRVLTEFIGQHGAAGGGMYIEAVCQGLDQVLDPYRRALAPGTWHLDQVLDPYRRALAGLEESVLEAPDAMPLSLLQHKLLPHRPVLKVTGGAFVVVQ